MIFTRYNTKTPANIMCALCGCKFGQSSETNRLSNIILRNMCGYTGTATCVLYISLSIHIYLNVNHAALFLRSNILKV